MRLINHRNLFLTVLEAKKSKIKGLLDSEPTPWFTDSLFPPMVEGAGRPFGCLLKGTHPIHAGFTLVT